VYKIVFAKEFKKQLKKIDTRYYSLIQKEIKHVSKAPYDNTDVVKDKNLNRSRKSRKGEYRIFYDIDDKNKTLIVLSVLGRGKAYKSNN
jgi:mRNA-degrading endonuclease RelE of RelBE toxin-antitoxin system